MWDIVLRELRRLFPDEEQRLRDWLKGLSRIERASVVASVILPFVIVVGTWHYHDVLSQWINIRLARVMFDRSTTPPITSHLRDALNHAINDDMQLLYGRLDQKRGQFAKQPWTTAEVILAISGRCNIDAGKAVDYFNSTMVPKISAWRRYYDTDAKLPAHVGASSWVLLALAQLKRPATLAQLNFILNAQQEPGWWPVYKSNDSEQNASTDATAMAIWSLQRQKAVAAGPNPQIEHAIRRGALWLWSNAHAARWKENPSDADVMLSVSGVALHALHMTKATMPLGLKEIDREWLRTLPSSIPKAGDTEEHRHIVLDEEGKPLEDASSYPFLPRIIAATIDAYPSGDLMERAFALSWLERVLRGRPLEQLKDEVNDWKLAVLLVALKQLESETPPKSGLNPLASDGCD